MALEQPRYILSPCGTSLWTNGANEAERKLLTAHANTGKREDIPAEERALLEARIAIVRGVMLAAQDTQEARKALAARKSAELNGILKLCGETLTAGQDYHLLLCTDTWQGEQSALLIADWLKQRHVAV